jgi:ABC-2 type transport system permease protein
MNDKNTLFLWLLFAALLPRGWGIMPPAGPAAFLLAVLGLFLGLLCMCALENITMAFTMRTLDSRGVQAMLNLLMMTLAGNILPLTLFPDSWQKAVTLLPYAQLLDAPIRLYTGQQPLSAAPRTLAVQCVWTLLLTCLGLLLWRQNQKRLVIQGG